MDADNFFLNHDIVMVAFCTVLGNGKRGDNLKIGPRYIFVGMMMVRLFCNDLRKV